MVKYIFLENTILEVSSKGEPEVKAWKVASYQQVHAVDIQTKKE
jgi:hypothetical protein